MKKVLTWFVVLLLLAGAGAALAGRSVWTRMHEPYKGYEGTEQFVTIPSGAGAGEIRRRLLEAKVVRDEFTLRAALRWTGNARALKAGEYRFDREMTAV